MIPNTIQRKHVLLAAEWIDQHGIPSGRVSKKYLVIINGRPYPPKLVISKAYVFASGSEWSHSNFTGGEEANTYLRGLGFSVVDRRSDMRVQEQRCPSGETCEKCGHSLAPDHFFCENCGHRLSIANKSSSRGVSARSVEPGLSEREFFEEIDTSSGTGSMAQVRRIARRLGTTVEDEVVGINQADNAIRWTSANHIAHIAPVLGGLLVYNVIPLDSSETLALSLIPKDTFDGLVRMALVGRTDFKLEREEMLLRTLIFFQRVLTDADDCVPAQLLVNTIEEVSTTSVMQLRLISDYSDSFHKGRETESKRGSPDNMYA